MQLSEAITLINKFKWATLAGFVYMDINLVETRQHNRTA